MHVADQVLGIVVGLLFLGGIGAGVVSFRQWQRAKQKLVRRPRQF